MKIYSKIEYDLDELSQIEIEHRKAYLRLFKSTIVVQTLFPIILVYVFYSIIADSILFSWLVALISLTFCRAYLTFIWFDSTKNSNKVKFFENTSLLFSFIAGCLWGVTVLAMNFKEYPEASVFLNIVVFGLTAGSVGIGSYWFGYFLNYNLAVFTFYIGAYLWGIPQPYYLLAISLSLFLIFMIQIALVFHRGNAENIWLSKRNEKLAKNLSDKKKQAEDLALSRTRFLAAASHDLRQPIQALNLFLTVLKAELVSDKCLQIYHKIEKCVEGMNQLLSSILDISKLDANTYTVNYQTIATNKILSDLEQQYSMQAKEKNLKLIIDKTPYYIKSDPILLNRILANLLSNAIRYTHNGNVSILVKPNKNNLLITIEDTGVGLSKVEQKKIFEEFYQLHNSERDRQKGLGLGLSIVKRLCELMQITLELHSNVGKGSCFSITLPLCDNPQNEIAIATVNPDVIQNIFNQINILVIDDDQLIREGLTELLTLWQCNVSSAESAEQACVLIEENNIQPDLLIVDYRLRDHKTGIQAIEKIRSRLNNEKLAAIIVSGDTDPERLREVSGSGFELLHKPVKPAHLRLLIQKILTTA